MARSSARPFDLSNINRDRVKGGREDYQCYDVYRNRLEVIKKLL